MLYTRWSTKYLKALREQHSLNHEAEETTLNPGDVVLIKGEERNRRLWKIEIVEWMILSRDGIVRGVSLRAGKLYLEQPVQHLYPLEMSCDKPSQERAATLNTRASEFKPRHAATVARIAEIADAAIAKDECEQN